MVKIIKIFLWRGTKTQFQMKEMGDFFFRTYYYLARLVLMQFIYRPLILASLIEFILVILPIFKSHLDFSV